jgi:hypothetical protein
MNPNDRISALLIVLLEAAQGAGMPKERAEAIYEDICAHFKNMDEAFPEALVNEIKKLMSID